MASVRRTTDYGTVVIHTVLVIGFAIAAATGLRIATDDPETPWLVILDPVLPTEHLWYNHLVSGIAVAASVVAYAVYVRRARLQSRIRFDRARFVSAFRKGKGRWAALNVGVLWVLLAGLIIEAVTGVLVFAGAGRLALTVHLYATFVCLGCVPAHIALHWAFGGLNQLLRIARPARLEIAPPPPDLAEVVADLLAKGAAPTSHEPTPAVPRPPPLPPRLQAHPLATGLAAGLGLIVCALGAERATRDSLQIIEVPPAEVPVLDGDLSDPVWAKAQPVTVLTTQGGDFGGTHQSRVEVRGVHDGVNVYLAFVWDDPTRSLKHMPLVNREGRWYVAASRDDLADEAKFNEDKFSVLLTPPGLPLLGAAIHLARQPLAGKPASSTGRGLHFVPDGIADVWLWRASHDGPYGHIDNCHFGGPEPAADPHQNPIAQYAGGFALDPGPPAYTSNIDARGSKAGQGAILPRRLPRDIAAMSRAMGRLSDTAGESESEGSRWWMLESETMPFDAALDARIADGTVIPSVVMADTLATGPASIRGAARWAAGRWTLEVTRRLYSGSRFDVPIKTGTALWVAAFDHAEKRHTRHLRPLRLEVE